MLKKAQLTECRREADMLLITASGVHHAPTEEHIVVVVASSKPTHLLLVSTGARNPAFSSVCPGELLSSTRLNSFQTGFQL